MRWFYGVLAGVFLVFMAASCVWATLKTADYQTVINPDILTGEYDSLATTGEFLGKKVDVPPYQPPTQLAVLGLSGEPKHIEVDLGLQRLFAYEGDKKVYDFAISSGKWNKTPTGTFHIWGKFRYTCMTGGSKLWHTFYDLPNVPFVMFFSNDQVPAARGFSLHGTYWHSNFGHPMSHGCINMRTSEAAILYDWTTPSVGVQKAVRATTTDPGTEIIIYGEAPQE